MEDPVETDEGVVDLPGLGLNDLDKPIRLVVNQDAVPVFGVDTPFLLARGGEVGVVTLLEAVDFSCPCPTASWYFPLLIILGKAFNVLNAFFVFSIDLTLNIGRCLIFVGEESPLAESDVFEFLCLLYPPPVL